MGSLFKPDVQDTTTRTELPPWLNQYGEWLTGSIPGMVDRPYTPYEGDRFAGFNPMQQAAFGGADAFGNMGLGALGQGYNALTDLTGAGLMGNAYSGLMGLSGPAGGLMQGAGGLFDLIGGMDIAGQDPISAMMVNASTSPFASAGQAQQAAAALANRGDIRNIGGGSFLDMDRDAYTNPYVQQVIQNTTDEMFRGRQMQDQMDRSAANAAGAFGGTRHGVQDALTSGEFFRNQGNMANMMNAQAFDAASGLMGEDLMRQFQANVANQGMDAAVSQLNAQLGTNVNLQNALMGNQMQQFNAGQQNQMGMFNAGQRNQVGLANAANALQAAGLNQNQTQMALQQMGLMGNVLGIGNNLLGTMGGIYGSAGFLGNAMANFGLDQGRALTDYGIQGLGMQADAGNQMQQFDQAQLDEQYRQFLEARDWQAQNFGMFGGMGLGAQGNTTTTGQAFGPSKGSQLIGGATGLLGGLGALGTGFGWGD
jgi:hypothetical protein